MGSAVMVPIVAGRVMEGSDEIGIASGQLNPHGVDRVSATASTGANHAELQWLRYLRKAEFSQHIGLAFGICSFEVVDLRKVH